MFHSIFFFPSDSVSLASQALLVGTTLNGICVLAFQRKSLKLKLCHNLILKADCTQGCNDCKTEVGIAGNSVVLLM